jgi:hypothetical protein
LRMPVADDAGSISDARYCAPEVMQVSGRSLLTPGPDPIIERQPDFGDCRTRCYFSCFTRETVSNQVLLSRSMDCLNDRRVQPCSMTKGIKLT